nr:MAG TPA: hypothetical protein [Caudoviricetes sp.]
MSLRYHRIFHDSRGIGVWGRDLTVSTLIPDRYGASYIWLSLLR